VLSRVISSPADGSWPLRRGSYFLSDMSESWIAEEDEVSDIAEELQGPLYEMWAREWLVLPPDA
jgi:hypothetical protein